MIEIIITIFVLVIVVALLRSLGQNNKTTSPHVNQRRQEHSKPTSVVTKNHSKHFSIDLDCNGTSVTKKIESKFAWLQERWKTAFEQRDTESYPKIVDEWFFDSPTEAQINRLEEDGVIVKQGKLTKGQYSDLIGVLAEPNEEALSIIKFFGGSTKGLSDAEASAKLRLILATEENRIAWENRPAIPRQKQFLKAMGEKVPKGLTHASAAQIQSDYFSRYYCEYSDYLDFIEDEGKNDVLSLSEWEIKKKALEDWELYEEILDEFDDPDFRDSYDIKRVPVGQLNKAIEELKNKGIKLSELADDLDLIIEQCISNNPKLERL